MTDTLARAFEHSNWANERVIECCSALDDAALDAPHPGTEWSLRRTLLHIVESQVGYVSLLTLRPEERTETNVAFEGIADAARSSGAELLAVVTDEEWVCMEPVLSSDGHTIDPWVVIVQALHHATDHRRQVLGMLRTLGVSPPRLDGWAFGDAVGAIEPRID